MNTMDTDSEIALCMAIDRIRDAQDRTLIKDIRPLLDKAVNLINYAIDGDEDELDIEDYTQHSKEMKA